MSDRALRAAVAAVRLWTRAYTRGLPDTDRERRRAEIESDLWESVNGNAAGPLRAWQIVGRLLLGLGDDVRWRVEQGEAAAPQRQAITIALCAIALLAVMWIGVSARRIDPPQPPAAPDLGWRHVSRKAPPPPPPPPPPCNPPGIGRPAFYPCTPYR